MTEPRIALVTGANRGIGSEVVPQASQRGLPALAGVRDGRKGAAAIDAIGGGVETVDVASAVATMTPWLVAPGAAMRARCRVSPSNRDDRSCNPSLSAAAPGGPHPQRERGQRERARASVRLTAGAHPRRVRGPVRHV